MSAPATASGPAIVTSRVTKTFGHVTALSNLTVEMPAGVVGLVGADGAGKSTLIKILLGLLPPTSGEATILGMDATTQGLAIRQMVGYMSESDCLPPDVSATELVVHLARMSGLPGVAARERAADTLRHMGLYEERYRPIGGYSTGMKQRVKLAQALVHDPRLVRLDGPTNGLDPAGRDEMLELIRRVGNDFGISVLVTSHLLGEPAVRAHRLRRGARRAGRRGRPVRARDHAPAIAALRIVVGGLLLVFGLQWLRKAVLRASGVKALHDEELIDQRQVAAAQAARTESRLGVSERGRGALQVHGAEGLEPPPDGGAQPRRLRRDAVDEQEPALVGGFGGVDGGHARVLRGVRPRVRCPGRPVRGVPGRGQWPP